MSPRTVAGHSQEQVAQRPAWVVDASARVCCDDNQLNGELSRKKNFVRCLGKKEMETKTETVKEEKFAGTQSVKRKCDDDDDDDNDNDDDDHEHTHTHTHTQHTRTSWSAGTDATDESGMTVRLPAGDATAMHALVPRLAARRDWKPLRSRAIYRVGWLRERERERESE